VFLGVLAIQSPKILSSSKFNILSRGLLGGALGGSPLRVAEHTECYDNNLLHLADVKF
jgi:hypothetical protein